MARIRDFAANHGGKVVLLGGGDKPAVEHEKVLCLEDINDIKDALSSLNLSVASEKCDTREMPMSDVHVICQSANFVSARLCPNLDYETTSSQPDKNAFDTKLYFDNLNTERIGRLCLYAGTVSSTFDLLPKAPYINDAKF